MQQPEDIASAALPRSGDQRAVLALLAAILAYPAFLALFHASGRLAVAAETPAEMVRGWGGVVGFMALAFAVPGFAFAVARAHSRTPLSAEDLHVRRLAHLAFAAPPLFTATGVVLFTFDLPGWDPVVWTIGWLGLFAWLARHRVVAPRLPAHDGKPPVPLRWAHGIAAAALLLLFLAGHLANHLVGLLGAATHRAVMDMLRIWYRSPYVEPAIIAGFLFMIGSGTLLARYRTFSFTDRLGTLQTMTGAYLAAFLTSHMTAVFILARWKSGTETDWFYATGAPAGLFADPWNVRLIPHYALAVACVATHAGCGLRVVLLAHGVKQTVADAIAWAVAASGALLAALIVLGMLA